MTASELEALARAQTNPFLGSVLRNGFEAPQNDVPEIHRLMRADPSLRFHDGDEILSLAESAICRAEEASAAWFGRLPGDIRYESDNVRVYVPIVSMLLTSIVLSLLFYLLRRFF